jgi:hypothetical protein
MRTNFKNWFKMFFVAMFLTTSNVVFLPAITGSGEVQAQTTDNMLGKFKQETQTAVTQIKDIVKIVLGVILVIGLIWVVWMVSQNHPKAKEAVIAWVVGIAMYGIGLALVG